MMTREEIRRSLQIEREILQEVYAKTGLRFDKVAGIDTQNLEIACAVLPALREWAVRHLGEMPENVRCAIYSRFITPYATAHMNALIEWWQQETGDLGLSRVNQAITKCAAPEHGARLWELSNTIPFRGGYFELWAKLATFPSVARQVRDRLVRALETESLLVGDLYDIATVNDPRIRKWFVGQLDSPNPDIRAVAKRVVKRGERLPRGVAYASSPPDRRTELYSTEIDLAEVKVTLGQIAVEFSLKVPAAVRKAKFLDYADLDRWVIAPVTTKNSGSACLWFRLEDLDTLEIVVTARAPGEPEQLM